MRHLAAAETLDRRLPLRQLRLLFELSIVVAGDTTDGDTFRNGSRSYGDFKLYLVYFSTTVMLTHPTKVGDQRDRR